MQKEHRGGNGLWAKERGMWEGDWAEGTERRAVGDEVSENGGAVLHRAVQTG